MTSYLFFHALQSKYSENKIYKILSHISLRIIQNVKIIYIYMYTKNIQEVMSTMLASNEYNGFCCHRLFTHCGNKDFLSSPRGLHSACAKRGKHRFSNSIFHLYIYDLLISTEMKFNTAQI